MSFRKLHEMFSDFGRGRGRKWFVYTRIVLLNLVCIKLYLFLDLYQTSSTSLPIV